MAGSKTTSKKKSRKGGKFLPALLDVFGVALILAVIALCLPMTAPRLFGYEPFEVVTGSMEPEIPVGSAVYVQECDLSTVSAGDIIAFYEGDSVVVHRVVTNRSSVGEFVTKGDANASEDFQPIPYANVIGTVQAHYDRLGEVLHVFSTVAGKVYLLLTVACGLMLIVLAGRIRRNRSARAAQIAAQLRD